MHADGADRLWSVDGTTIRFHRVPPREMFGITSGRLDSESVVPMFDRERSLAELLTRSGPEGTEWGTELVRHHGQDIDHARLRQHGDRLDADRQPSSVFVASGSASWAGRHSLISPRRRRLGIRLAEIERRTGVPHESVVRDDALSYMVAGIAAVPELAERAVFKGGTALRKCYFAGYRY